MFMGYLSLLSIPDGFEDLKTLMGAMVEATTRLAVYGAPSAQ